MGPINPILLLQSWTSNTPGVSLTIPSNGGTVNTVNPQLRFVGQSVSGDQNHTYQIQIDTVNTFSSQTPAIPVTVMAWGGGGSGNGYSASGWTTGSGGGGGFGQSSVTISNGTGYTVVVGTGGVGPASNPSGATVGQAGGNSYFTTTGSAPTTSSQGALGAGGGSTNSLTPGTGGTANIGSVTYNGGNGGTGSTPGSGGGGGGAGNQGAGGVGGTGVLGGSTTGGTGGAGTFPGGAGGAGVGAGSGQNGGFPGGGGSGAGTSSGGNAGSGGNGQVIIQAPKGLIASATGGTYSSDALYDYWTFTSSGTWTPVTTGPLYDKKSASDAGFTDITNAANADPFPSGDTVGYTVGATGTITPSAATVTNFASSVLSMPVNLPSVSAGNLLLAWVEARNTGSYTPPAGWTQLALQVPVAGQLTVFYKIADGSEGATATWTSSASTTATWQVRKVSNWHGTTPPEVTFTTGDNSNADSPSITPSWGSADTLYISVAGHASLTATAFTGGPSGYSDFLNSGQSTGGSSTSLASAYKTTTASTSEDPGAFNASGSNRYWGAVTIAVRPQVPFALTDHTTYYWRVRTVVPTNNVSLVGDWSSVQSFTVSTAPQYTRTHTTSTYKLGRYTRSHTTDIFIRGNKNYTRAGLASLPTNSTDLTTAYTNTEYGTVSSDNSTYVNVTGTNYLLHQFKYEHSNSTNAITITWNGRASRAPSSNTVYLQIWNYNTSAWETVASNNSASANTDFTLTGGKTTSLSNYYNSNIVTARVYQ